MTRFIFKNIALSIAITFWITTSHAQSLPTSYYGIWDRGEGIDYSVTPADFVLGIETMSLWEDIQPTGPNSWDFSFFQQEIDKAVAYNKLIRFSVNVGPESPMWLFDNGVPLVHVLSNAPKNDKYADRYPYYLDPDYKAYYFAMIEQFALFLRNQPQEKFNHIAFVQVKTGSTGDEEAYKGTPIIGAINNNIDYTISKTDWENFRIQCFGKFKQYFNDVPSRKIVLTFNNIDPITEPDAYNWVMSTMDPAVGFGMKGGAYNRGHHLSDEQTYKEQWTPYLINPHQDAVNTQGLKLFSASEMDQSWTKGYFAKNYEIGFYWAALGGLNTGVSCTNVSASAMQYALANPGIIEIFKMYNRYAQQVYPQTATTAFSVFHEGLNSADTQKFPTATYGSPANQSNVTRYQNICNSTKYYNRGARMDEPLLATYGQVYQRENQVGYNDAGWEIAEGNIERFMTQINPDDTSIGLFRVRGTITASSSKYDRFARSFENSTGRNTMYFKLDSQLPASNKILKFTIIWLDKTAGSTWAFKYRNAAGLQSIPFTGTGTNEWRTEIFNISDGVMNQGGVNGSDFMLVNTDTIDDIFNGIEMNIIGIGKQDQTINFNALPSKTVGEADFNPGATASSGLAVTYTSSNTNVATIINNTIHIVGSGVSTITASQAGNDNYNPATPVTQNLSVVLQTMTTTFATSGTWTCPTGVNTITVEAWGGGGAGGTATTGGVGGGGAGGSYVINNTVAVAPNTIYNITVGAGGIASSTASTTGTAAESTTFQSTTPVIAYGGVAGSNASGTNTVNTAFGSGGINLVGGSGGMVTLGSAGTTGATSSGGKGGDGAGPNGGSGGASDTTTNVNTPGIGGNNGTAPGGGGSGAYGAASGSRVGGTGGAGLIIITYTVGVPNAPIIGTATVSGVSGQALIPFTAPAFDGNSTITSYTATSSPGGITATVSQAGSGTIIMNGLTNGITYTFTVRATNSIGQSAESAASNSVTPINQASIVSNGTGGGSWLDTATWAGGVVPTENNTVEIIESDSITLNGIGICNNLTINSGSLTVSSGSLTVKNTLVNNGTLTIENNANLIQTTVANTNFGTGTATVKRNSNPLKRLDYTLWSSPVSGSQTLAQFSPLTSTNRFYTYDSATNLYTAVAPTSTFAAGAGYLIRMPNEGSANYNSGSETLAFPGQFTGTLNNGTIPVAVTKGYNLVGNPYPSNISFSSLISENSSLIGTTAYFWRKTNAATVTSAYCTYNNTGSTYVSNGQAGAATLFDGTIKSGQGFFVNATSGGTLNFTNAQRTGTTANQAFFKTRQVVADKLWLNATNTVGAFSQMAVTYSDGATTGVDRYDSKFINDSGYALTSNINGEEYTIQGRSAFDATDVVALNFKTATTGDYTIALANTEGVFAAAQDIYLVDSKTGAETNLKTGSYTFTAAAGVDNSRFSLKYQKTLKIDAPAFNENTVKVYKNNGTLYVNSGRSIINTIEVYDIQGRLIAKQKAVKATTAIVNNLKATHQVLIVKVYSEDGQLVSKKVMN